MTSPLSVVPRWFSIDCDHDISADVVSIMVDGGTWVTATYGAPPSDVIAQLALTKPVETGFIRYWYMIMTGPGQLNAPGFGMNTFHGRVVDSPSTWYTSWKVHVPYE